MLQFLSISRNSAISSISGVALFVQSIDAIGEVIALGQSHQLFQSIISVRRSSLQQNSISNMW